MFLDYEKWDPIGYNSGNSRNGYYHRTVKNKYNTMNLIIPRDRNGSFHQQTVPAYKQTSDSLETTIIQLYQKGITTREIVDLLEKMYGHHYSPATISNMAKLVQEDVKAFHTRSVKEDYVVIYADTTYIPVRRDRVRKEALHVLIGIDPSGKKEVLDYALFPEESCRHYQEMIRDLKQRGLKRVLLFVSDGLTGLADALSDVFPRSKHQSCWTHLIRQALSKGRAKDKEAMTEVLKKVYDHNQSVAEAQEHLEEFLEIWGIKYPRLKTMFENTQTLLTFYLFPECIRPSLYTNNISENLNKHLKRKTKVKEQFPHEDRLDRAVCSYVLDNNLKGQSQIHKGFGKVTFELLEMFDNAYSDEC